MSYKINPTTGKLDYYESAGADASYLKLDQTTPQTVTEGIPILKDGCPTVITRNSDGFITKKEYKNGYYIEYTRDASNVITSCTDGTYTWTPTYSSGFITSVAVTLNMKLMCTTLVLLLILLMLC